MKKDLNPLHHLVVRYLGIMPYRPVWLAMQRLTQQRTDTSVDEVWLLQHEPVFTLGQAGKTEHVLSPGDIPLVKSDRGGQVTYHGPGQLVAYILVRLPRLKIGTRDLVTIIEQTLIDTLAAFSIDGSARADAPGVYVEEAKIASLGLRIRRGSSYHGLALNVDMDLEPFLRINPCGYAGLKMVQLKDFIPVVDLSKVTDIWLGQFKTRMGYQNLIEEKGLPNYE